VDFVSRTAASRLSRRRAILAGGSALVVGLTRRGRAAASEHLPSAITAVMSKPRYAESTWNLFVTDLATGQVVYELEPDQLALTGSVRKLFSVGLALRQLGADHRFTTPVHRMGTVDTQGTVDGDLILVAAGDLTLGGRVTSDDIAVTTFDHNDANNLGTAVLTPQDPLHGLDSLAEQVRAAGIRHVAGDVVIDDRLFESFRVPNGNLLITPILVNENMVDVTVSPTRPGEAAVVSWRPHTGAFAVDAGVMTTAAGTPDTVTLSGNGRVECIGADGCIGSIEGDIPVGYQAPLSGQPDLVQTFRIEDPPAFARTAFIEALQRVGVTVAASPFGDNPVDTLPAMDAYTSDTRVAEFISPPYAGYARLILKVSLNLGANLSLMLFGLAHGKRTIAEALAVERQTLIDDFGLQPDAFNFPTNGSGSPDSQATARATVQLLEKMALTDVAAIYASSLPILGVDGSLAGSGVDLPGRGHVFAKTGTTLEAGAIKAQNLAGYIEARSGRRLAFALFLNDGGPIQELADITEVIEDEAKIVSAIYEAS
jgi:D-alanyl-D-alanine carboxypeptidase/D-alanyl-D-alanine-endopeptidase (penicillin-binding protein 4)